MAARMSHRPPLLLRYGRLLSLSLLCLLVHSLIFVSTSPSLAPLRKINRTVAAVPQRIASQIQSLQSQLNARMLHLSPPQPPNPDSITPDLDNSHVNMLIWALGKLLVAAWHVTFITTLRLFIALPVSETTVGFAALLTLCVITWCKKPRYEYSFNEDSLYVTRGRFRREMQHLAMRNIADISSVTRWSDLLLRVLCYGERVTITITSPNDMDQPHGVCIPAATRTFCEFLARTHAAAINQQIPNQRTTQ